MKKEFLEKMKKKKETELTELKKKLSKIIENPDPSYGRFRSSEEVNTRVKIDQMTDYIKNIDNILNKKS